MPDNHHGTVLSEPKNCADEDVRRPQYAPTPTITAKNTMMTTWSRVDSDPVICLNCITCRCNQSITTFQSFHCESQSLRTAPKAPIPPPPPKPSCLRLPAPNSFPCGLLCHGHDPDATGGWISELYRMHTRLMDVVINRPDSLTSSVPMGSPLKSLRLFSLNVLLRQRSRRLRC